MADVQKEIAVVDESTTELVSIEAANDYLASYADEVTDNLGNPSLKWVSTKHKKFKIDGNPVEGNRLICVILAHKYTNVLYMKGYKEDELSIPACFAISDKRATLAPHDDVIEKKCATCAPCKYNQMKSAGLLKYKERKEGKACSNRMRLALLPVGYINKKGDIIVDDSTVLTEEIVFISVPVMSINNFTKYAKNLANPPAGKEKKSPLSVVTVIDLADSEKTTWEMTFTELKQAKNVDGKLLPINLSTSKETLPKIIARHQEAKSLIMTPYPTSLPQQAVVEGSETEATQEAAEEDTDDF